MIIENSKIARERIRIHWRSWVLSMPLVVAFLRRFVRCRERDVGPHKLRFSEEQVTP